MPKHPFRSEIARAGLDSLMADPRYFDPGHPEHGAMVDMVQRGFQLIFDGPKDRAWRNPALTGPVPRPGLLDGVLKNLLGDRDGFESAPTAERQRQGRGVMLAALKADGFALPSGLGDEDAPAVKFPVRQTGIGGKAQAGTDHLPTNKRGDESPRREPNPAPPTAESNGAKPAPRTGPDTPKEPPFQPRRPIDEKGKEIWPHHEDPRFKPDGTLKEGFAENPALRWAAENSRYNPKTKTFEFYQDLPEEFQRDTRQGQGGRWRKVKPKPENGQGQEEFVNPKRIPSPPPLPDRDTFMNRKKLLRYLAELGGWVLENFGDEVRRFAAEEKKGR